MEKDGNSRVQGTDESRRGHGANYSVSVVIPTHNRVDLLRTALQSALSQTYSPAEIIVVDDASDDPRQYADLDLLNDPRVKYVRNETSRGPSGARNVGIQLASSDLVAFLDDDDEWLPEKLERQVGVFVQHPDVGAVYCPCIWRDLDTGVLSPRVDTGFARGRILAKQVIEDHTCGTPTYVVKRGILIEVGGFDEALAAREDWDLAIRLSAKCEIGFVDEDLVIAGRHTRLGVSKNCGNLLAAQRQILHKYSSLRKGMGIAIDQKAKARYYASAGMLNCYAGRRLRGALLHLLGILNWPVSASNYSGLIKACFPLSVRVALSRLRRRCSGT